MSCVCNDNKVYNASKEDLHILYRCRVGPRNPSLTLKESPTATIKYVRVSDDCNIFCNSVIITINQSLAIMLVSWDTSNVPNTVSDESKWPSVIMMILTWNTGNNWCWQIDTLVIYKPYNGLDHCHTYLGKIQCINYTTD